MSHANAGAILKPHVLPLRVYFAVAASLLALTVVTVWVSYLAVGTTLGVVIAMAVATIKASLVTLFFMHLKYDERFNGVVFVSAFVFLSLFFVFTLADTSRRGEVDPLEKGLIRVLPESSIPPVGGHEGEPGHAAEPVHDTGESTPETAPHDPASEPAGGAGGH